MYCGIENNQHIHNILNSEIKIVDNLKYLGLWMESTEKISISINHWPDQPLIRWRSYGNQASDTLKVRGFRATIETIYIWCKNMDNNKINDQTNWRMLHQTSTNGFKYILERRLKLVGDLIKHNNILVHKLVLWEHTNGIARRNRKTITYVDNLL